MARTNKIGIDYFPFDVDFFQDDKIQLIEAEFGVKGGYIAIRLLCKIYREGYYYQWGANECLLFTKNVGVEGVSRSIVDEVVKGLVKRGFFNESVFNSFKVLTSAGIQKRYFEITKRYKNVEVIKEYLLINVSDFDNVNIIPINVDINSKNVDINPQKKRKEKKLNETKLNETKKEIPPDVNSILISQPLLRCKSQLLSDRSWLDIISMNFSKQFKNFQVPELDGYIDQFFDKLENEGEDSKSIKDAKQHFSNWLRIELTTSKTLPTNTNHADRSIDRSRF